MNNVLVLKLGQNRLKHHESILSEHEWPGESFCIFSFGKVFLPIFSRKMKNDGQPMRGFVPWNCWNKEGSRWLNNVFLFSTEIGAEQLKNTMKVFSQNTGGLIESSFLYFVFFLT